MRKKIFFIIAIILIGFIVIEKNIQMTNNIKIYNVGVDSCCTYLINNFVDNEKLLHSILEELNNSKYPVNSFITNEVHIPADTRSAFPVISVQSPVSIQCCWQS